MKLKKHLKRALALATASMMFISTCITSQAGQTQVVVPGTASGDEYDNLNSLVPENYKLGYYLENKFQVSTQFVDKYNMMAIGGLKAQVLNKDGVNVLHIEGCWEEDLTKAWTTSPAYIGKLGKEFDDPYWEQFKNPYKLPDSPKDTKMKFESIDATPYEVYDEESNACIKQDSPSPITYSIPTKEFSSGNAPAFKTGGGISYNYWGYESIPVEIKINNQEYQFVIPIKKPSGLEADLHYGEFKYDFPIDKSFGNVPGVTITKMLFKEIQYLVYTRKTADEEMTEYAPMIENFMFSDKSIDGDNTTYTLKVETNSPFNGNLLVKVKYYDGSYAREQEVKIPVIKGKSSAEGEFTVPSESNYFYIEGCRSVETGKAQLYGYADNIHRGAIMNRSYVISFNHESNGFDDDIVRVFANFDYSINTPGEYEFSYEYKVPGETVYAPMTKTITQNYNLNDATGNYSIGSSESGTTSLVFPKDTYYIKLVSVKSPDGIVKNIDEVIYRNAPATPDELYFDEPEAVIFRTEPRLEVGVKINYGTPNDKGIYFVFEYEENGEIKTKTKKVSVKEGYGTAVLCGENDSGTPVDLPKDTPYIKLLRAEAYNEETEQQEVLVEYNDKYLYCVHDYRDACDSVCHICAAPRKVEHKYTASCDAECDLCGYVRVPYAKHAFSYECSSICNYCGYEREKRSHSFYMLDETSLVCDYCNYCMPYTGWMVNDDCVYYLAEDKAVKGWNLIEGFVYYFDEDARMHTGWLDYHGFKYYFDSERGFIITGWEKINGSWYYFDEDDGTMQTGWKTINGKTYYLGSTGTMVSNKWMKKDGRYVYLDKSGVLKTGWVNYNNKYYYMDEYGYLVSGWVSYKNAKYYLDPADDSAMVTGWKKINGIWYCFDSNGKLVTNNWAKDGTKWYYLDSNGMMVTKKWISHNSKWYYVETNGVMATSKWIQDGNSWYYVDENGSMVTEKWIKSGGKWYYLQKDGTMAKSTWIGDDYVDETGAYLKSR